jgi:hypothetical protein
MRRSKWFSLIAVFIIAGFLFQPALGLAQSDYDAGYAKGEEAGVEHLDAGRKVVWFACGLLTGIIGTGIAYFHKPKSTARIYLEEGTSDEYRRGFIEGFCKTVNTKRAGYAAAGWVAWVVILFSSRSS